MNLCCEFFCKNAKNLKKVKELLKEPERMIWENISASEDSPCTVKDEEVLVRQIMRPHHIEQTTGEISPTAFEDVFGMGLSVHRLAYCTVKEAVFRGEIRAQEFNTKHPEKPQRSLLGLVEFQVNELRALIVEGQTRAVCVYDTALKDDTSHADICRVAEQTSKNQRRVRSQLFEAAKRGRLSITWHLHVGVAAVGLWVARCAPW